MIKVWKWLSLFVVVLILGCGIIAAYLNWYVNDRPIEITDGQSEAIIKVKKGDTAKEILDELANEGLQLDPTIAGWAFRYFEADRNIHVGRYRVDAGWTLKQLIDHLKSGKIIMSRYTVVEGTRTNNFLRRIQTDDDFELPENPWTPEEVMHLVGAPEGTFPEGQFAADTYVFAAGAPLSLTLKQAYREQQKRVENAWMNRDPEIAVKNPYELLILASIIEKETGSPEDRPLVSSVFNNRLKKGMLLQTDPTVIYGIENFQGKILKSHLKTDHPYNTYIHAGLPPTPIAIPGLAAIEAAAHPANTDYLYFVAKADGTGRSYFSTNLKEHNEAVRKYLRSQGK